MFRFIKLNKAKCLRCNSIVISQEHRPSDVEVCDCGSLKISGGRTHLIRNGTAGRDYEELTIIEINDQNCPDVNAETVDPEKIKNIQKGYYTP